MLCREHGQQLTELAASNKIDGFNLFGVIKETGVVRFSSSFLPYCVLYSSLMGVDGLGRIHAVIFHLPIY